MTSPILRPALCCALAAATLACVPMVRVESTPLGSDTPEPRKVLVLPVDFGAIEVAEHYRPEAAVALTKAGTGKTYAALYAELSGRGYEVVGRLGWSGRIIWPDDRYGPVVATEHQVAQLLSDLLDTGVGEMPLMARIRSATGADTVVLASGSATVLSEGRKAAQAAAVTGIVIVSVVIVAGVIAVAATGLKGLGKGLGKAGKGPSGGGSGSPGGSSASVPGAKPAVVTWRPGRAGIRALLLPLEIAARTSSTTVIHVPMYLPPGHLHGPACAPSLGVHDGVVPPPAERPTTRFWSGSRAHLSVGMASTTDGRLFWEGSAEGGGDFRNRDRVRRMMGWMFRSAPPAGTAPAPDPAPVRGMPGRTIIL